MSTTLKASSGSPFARLYSVASALPSRTLDNDYMCQFIDSSDEWIRQRTGIAERQWIGDGESLETLCLQAGRTAIERSGVDPSKIDAVILSTVSVLAQTPALSPKLASELGLVDAAAYDVNGACAGFSYTLAQAESMIRCGQAHYVLLISADTLSEMTDIHDRSTAFIFGDGAGAAVVGPSDVNGIGPVVWGSDGSQADVIRQTASWSDAIKAGKMPAYCMNGQAVFKWATTFISKATLRCLDAAGVTPDQLEVFIPHQANDRITDVLMRHMHLPESVTVARTITHTGNTSASSIPIAMDLVLQSGQAKPGQTALIIGFGAGLVYAGQVITLP